MHNNQPVYPIGVVAEMLNVHPETIRVWERNGVVHPARRSGRRFYSDDDLKRLRFIQKLTFEGLNLPAIRHYLRLYPCWKMEGCPHCMHRSEDTHCNKPCWKEEGVYCQASAHDDTCRTCEYRTQETERDAAALEHEVSAHAPEPG